MFSGHSAESRAKIAAARRGRPHSPETRAKMSASHTGKVLSPETRQALRRSSTEVYRRRMQALVAACAEAQRVLAETGVRDA